MKKIKPIYEVPEDYTGWFGGVSATLITRRTASFSNYDPMHEAHAVGHMLARCGRRMKPIDPTKISSPQAVKMYRSGMSIKEIATGMKVSYASVASDIKLAGL